jgi:hypothetical protein
MSTPNGIPERLGKPEHPLQLHWELLRKTQAKCMNDWKSKGFGILRSVN